MVRLTLYSVLDCAVCDELLVALEQHPRAGTDFAVDVVDIKTQADLETCYGLIVPVLNYGEERLCAGVYGEGLWQKIDALLARADRDA